MKVAVIGGGPAGMMAAIAASKSGNQVFLIEKNSKLGVKLLITGKGRCNLTSSLPMSKFIENVPGNGRFLYSAFQNFTNEDIINFMREQGLNVKEERGNRIFPVSDKSIDVLKAFEKALRELKVNIILNSKVIKIEENNKQVTGVEYLSSDGKKFILKVDKIIIATGGSTYSQTGSNGEGYKLVMRLGHKITKIQPSLVPLVVDEKSLKICKEMQGLSLKNVKIYIFDTNSNKRIYEDFGEMIFTHFGVSGPIILSASTHILRYKNINMLLKCGKVCLKIDLKPALSVEKLDERIQRDFANNKNKEFKNSLNELLPQKMINTVINLSNINKYKKVNEITRSERINLVNLLKNFTLIINGFRPIDEGIVTAGGIDIKDINPKTMESKLVKGLFFAGEIIDVDAYTGGFNLQIAYSTGYTAGI